MTPPTSEQVADVAPFLEGTYPYVLGGVSSWVDQIIRGLPELTFALFYLGSEKKTRPGSPILPALQCAFPLRGLPA